MPAMWYKGIMPTRHLELRTPLLPKRAKLFGLDFDVGMNLGILLKEAIGDGFFGVIPFLIPCISRTSK